MKLLHIFTLPTTAESFFDGQFGYLAENGHDITVLANSFLDGEFCKKNNIKSNIIPITREINPFKDIKAIISLIRIIRRNRYDVVIGHTPKGAMVAMSASLLSGTKKRVYYRHGLIYTTTTGLRHLILKTIERVTALCATNIINVSPSLSKLAIKDHLNSSDKQIVIGKGTCGGIDTQMLFNPKLINKTDLDNLKRKLKISNQDFIIGFCGRLCHDKGIIELIQGFQQLKRNNPKLSVKLLLVRPFDSLDILTDDIKNIIETSGDILSTGFVKQALLPKLYSIMDVFVFPSYREGFGMCVIEASAMEVPILVSRSHGCVDSIQEHYTGEYIEISAESIAKGIENLYFNPILRKRLGKNGRHFVKENFEQQTMWPKIKDFYDEFI